MLIFSGLHLHFQMALKCMFRQLREGESEDMYMAASQTPLRLMADATPLKRLQASAFCSTS